MPTKVAHIIPSFYPALYYGGPVLTTFELCRALSRHDCQVRVLTTNADGPNSVLSVNPNEERELSASLRVRYCARIGKMDFSVPLFRAIPKHVEWAEVVHLTAVYSAPTLPVLLASKVRDRPVVWSPRGSLQRWHGTRKPSIKRWFERACRAAAPPRLIIHATSEDERRESQDKFPNVPCVIIPNGVNVPEHIDRIADPATLRLMYLGRLDPKKGIFGISCEREAIALSTINYLSKSLFW